MLFGRRSWEISCRFYEFFVNFVSPAYKEHRAKSFGSAIDKNKKPPPTGRGLSFTKSVFLCSFNKRDRSNAAADNRSGNQQVGDDVAA